MILITKSSAAKLFSGGVVSVEPRSVLTNPFPATLLSNVLPDLARHYARVRIFKFVFFFPAGFGRSLEPSGTMTRIFFTMNDTPRISVGGVVGWFKTA